MDDSGRTNAWGDWFFAPVSQSFSRSYEVLFEGEDCCCASAYDFAPNMTQYAVCTTIQYSYKPSVNSTTTTITSTTPDIERQTRRLEEMEQEAKNNGWFSVEHEFIRFFPWYRIHYRITVNETIIDVGFCPFGEIFGLLGRIIFNLQDAETYMWHGLEIFSEVVEKCWEQIISEALVLFVEFIAAKIGESHSVVAAAALVVETISEMGFLWYHWYDWQQMLATGLANIILSLISLKVDIAVAFVNALIDKVTAETMPALYLLMNKAIVMVEPVQPTTRTIVDMVGIAIFLIFGAIALARGMGLI